MRAYLEHYSEQGGPAESVEIATSPFVIGRSRSAKLTIYSNKVSHQHAQISLQAGGYRIRDLGSTNGTFVNGQRIEEAPLQGGGYHPHSTLGVLLQLEAGRRIACLQHGRDDPAVAGKGDGKLDP